GRAEARIEDLNGRRAAAFRSSLTASATSQGRRSAVTMSAFLPSGAPPVSVVFVAASQLPTPFGVFTMHGFLDQDTGKEHVVLTMGDVADGKPVLGRLHSECLTGDALFSLRCD